MHVRDCLSFLDHFLLSVTLSLAQECDLIRTVQLKTMGSIYQHLPPPMEINSDFQEGDILELYYGSQGVLFIVLYSVRKRDSDCGG